MPHLRAHDPFRNLFRSGCARYYSGMRPSLLPLRLCRKTCAGVVSDHIWELFLYFWWFFPTGPVGSFVNRR